MWDENRSGQRLTREAVIGTWDFMSPEQAFDTSRADHRSDIDSLGCTLFWLIAGRSPYESFRGTQVLLAHQQAPIPALSDFRDAVPKPVEDVVDWVLAKDPSTGRFGPAVWGLVTFT